MNWVNWYVDMLKNKYAEFSGRAGRQEFWMFVLFNLVIGIVLSGVDMILGRFGYLHMLFALATLVPGLAVGARRLHDTDRPGLLLLIWLTCIGGIVLIVFWAQEGQSGSNQYGPPAPAINV